MGVFLGGCRSIFVCEESALEGHGEKNRNLDGEGRGYMGAGGRVKPGSFSSSPENDIGLSKNNGYQY